MSETEKAVVFVNHIQNHLNNGHTKAEDSMDNLKNHPKIGCMICGLTIDDIYEIEKVMK